MRDFYISLVRSIVPAVVTAITGWLTHWGLQIDPNGVGGLESALFALGYALYYGVVRLFEIHVSPQLGWLLGHPAAPKYVEPETVNFTDIETPTAATAK